VEKLRMDVDNWLGQWPLPCSPSNCSSEIGSSATTCPQAGVTQAPPKRTETNFETPGSCMVTP